MLVLYHQQLKNSDLIKKIPRKIPIPNRNDLHTTTCQKLVKIKIDFANASDY